MTEPNEYWLHMHRFKFTEKTTIGNILDDDGQFVCYTLEDKDRKLEGGGEKVYGQTAIPRGFYRVILSRSNRFKRIMPEILDVPQFTGIRMHGGNDEHDTEGCPLLAEHAEEDRVWGCKPSCEKVERLIAEAERQGKEVWLAIN